MIQTINPYSTARTAEIMSRYRPIAPKPEAPANSASENDSSIVPSGLRKSPYLRNVWTHLQARSTRTRKRGRIAAFSPPSVKRARSCLQGLSPPYQVITTASPTAMHGFANGLVPHISLVPLKCGLDTAVTTLAESVALPLLRRTAAAASHHPRKESCGRGIDLNTSADNLLGPEELDLLLKLQEPKKTTVISPRPLRPVGSSIVVKRISGGNSGLGTMPEKEEEVEEAVEAEVVPSVVSDSNNKVRIANSAYREMVGQPECGWLDCAAAAAGKHGKRIGGEVCLRFEDSEVVQVLMSVHGFSCRVTIEWESEGKKKSVEACCSGVRLGCRAKDYQFLWRFHIIEEASSRSVHWDN